MKRYDLNGRVIAFTGATGGLGLAVAKALHAKGAKLALLDLDLEAVQQQAAALGGPDVAAGWSVNVRSMGSLEAALAAAAKHFGKVDVMIAGAGIAHTNPMEVTDPAHCEAVVDINLTGVWRTFKAALPYVQQTQGYLLAVSSMAAFVHSPLNTAYTATKAGVWALCNSLRLEVKHLGVGVGTLHPTFFQTPIMQAAADGPCSEYIWNGHQGMWKFTALEDVVQALVGCIEYRRQSVTVPKSNSLAAIAPGFVRKLVERFGFDDGRVAEAMRIERESKARRAIKENA